MCVCTRVHGCAPCVHAHTYVMPRSQPLGIIPQPPFTLLSEAGSLAWGMIRSGWLAKDTVLCGTVDT